MAWNCLKFTEGTLWHNMMVDFDRFSLTLSKKKKRSIFRLLPEDTHACWLDAWIISNNEQPVTAFSSSARILEECLTTKSLPALFFFFWAQINLRTLIPLFRPGQDQSSVAQHTETTVTDCSLTTCMWARFLICSHTMPAQRHSQPTTTSLGQRCMHV